MMRERRREGKGGEKGDKDETGEKRNLPLHRKKKKKTLVYR